MFNFCIYKRSLLKENKGFEVNEIKKDFNISVLILGNISLFILLFSRLIIGLNGSNDITHFNYSFILLNVILTAFVFNINTILLRDISVDNNIKSFFISTVLLSIIASILYYIIFNYNNNIIELIYKRDCI